MNVSGVKVIPVIEVLKLKGKTRLRCPWDDPPVQCEADRADHQGGHEVREQHPPETYPTAQNGNDLRMPGHPGGNVNDRYEYGDWGDKSGDPWNEIEVVPQHRMCIEVVLGELVHLLGNVNDRDDSHQDEHHEEKVNIIVSFLAMLELVKQGIISVNQEKHTDDIDIETETLQVPNYN